MRRHFLTAVIIAACMSVTACGSSANGNKTEEAPAAEESTAAEESIAVADETAADGTAEPEAATEEPEAAGEEPAEEFMPGSFVEYAAGKETFESFDELISYLKDGEAYTYFDIEGFDGQLLAVTDGTFKDLEGHNAAIEATFYGNVDGTVRFVGNAFSGGTAYPIRCDGAVIYAAGNHEYQSEFMGADGTALIVKDYIHVEYDESGNASYTGFMRDTNASDGDDIPDDPKEAEKIFEELSDGLYDKPVMDFTIVGGEAKAGRELPPYEYTGDDPVMAEVHRYIVDELASHYDRSDVSIPCVTEVYTDKTNKDDIVVYGDFWIYNYDLLGNTLMMMSGGSYPGAIHLKEDRDGYTVTSFDEVEDGSGYTPSAKRIFGEHYDAFAKAVSDDKKNEETRAQTIADYVSANGLSITQYQDYGWDPVQLP